MSTDAPRAQTTSPGAPGEKRSDRSTRPRCRAGVPSGLVTGMRRARTEAGLLVIDETERRVGRSRPAHS